MKSSVYIEVRLLIEHDEQDDPCEIIGKGLASKFEVDYKGAKVISHGSLQIVESHKDIEI